MAKEIPEELKNYNKYPGEPVTVLPNETVKIGQKTFRLAKDYNSAFDSLALEQRYSGVFDKFDYVVGDWGHELLRLRGFYENDKKKVPADEKIDHLADYLQEYCSYGCPYFVLERQRAEGEVDSVFDDGKEDNAAYRPKKVRRSRSFKERDNGREDSGRAKEKGRQGSKSRLDDALLTQRPDAAKVTANKKRPKNQTKIQNKTQNKPQTKSSNKNRSKNGNKPKFVIRERKEK